MVLVPKIELGHPDVYRANGFGCLARFHHLEIRGLAEGCVLGEHFYKRIHFLDSYRGLDKGQKDDKQWIHNWLFFQIFKHTAAKVAEVVYIRIVLGVVLNHFLNEGFRF